MAKGTILDRLAGAMKTLGKREGKALTPKQRVAAAQRFNSLADVAEEEWKAARDELLDAATLSKDRYEMYDRQRKAQNEIDKLYKTGLISEGHISDNPFLSDNIDKYQEQSEFLDWCRYNRVEPNARSLKQFRWETYKTLPYRQQQWIANKDAIRQGVRDEDFVSPYTDDLRTLQDLDDAALDYSGSKYDFMKLPVYKSYEEFPDDFDYMWRY